MKVIISGYYGFDNTGDEAILKSMIIALKTELKDIDIVVLSDNPQKTKKDYCINSINRWNLKDIYLALKESDGLISGGGSLLQDITSSRNIIYYTFIIGIARFLNKPVFIYSQGIGPINKKINKKIVKYFLNKVQYISIRDKISLNVLQSIGVNKMIRIVPDPVMGLEYKTKESNHYKDYIIINIREWKYKDIYMNQISKFCNEISKFGIEIKLLIMHESLDSSITKELSKMILSETEIISDEFSIEEKLKYISEAKLVIGMRLHSLIFAGNVGTPMIGISYDPKVDSYLDSIGQPCIRNIDKELDYKELLKKAMYMIENNEYLRKEILKNTKELKVAAKLTASMAIDIFKTYN
ncbi:polysaccharide pyruvyl transferase CsaB [[Clostridium] sordellii]|uniref:polysaccharide pyruvyl transferase CsaB n=1 Tax=Paraclostridium sordellii TaxID=1505 RepID=UPI0005DF310B|nr:polysaccharide pyruvyl transferase CsaB [Paeniclostridium sordellii]MDU1454585.1 polysaccharide pyruvyl transferase CsaB [Paeniclostridium sordellii]CEO10834.1 polysaccharide pyruvyl transferase CsaB [[Clostridium] sordellii] [Paeniclostridium sordellii]